MSNDQPSGEMMLPTKDQYERELLNGIKAKDGPYDEMPFRSPKNKAWKTDGKSKFWLVDMFGEAEQTPSGATFRKGSNYTQPKKKRKRK